MDHHPQSPYQIKVVDWKCLLDGPKPYIIYVIETVIGDDAGNGGGRWEVWVEWGIGGV